MGMGTPSKNTRMSISEINVTPLVDVMLVLLIIFMVTTPMMNQGVDVDLPETRSSGVSTPEDPFILTITKKGGIFIDKVEIPLAGLSDKIEAIFSVKKDKQVYIQADQQVEYGIVAQAMAEVRGAGIYKIALITKSKK